VVVWDTAKGARSDFVGLAQIRACFQGLFAQLSDLGTLAAPVVEVTEAADGAPGMVFLVWECPGSGVRKATDTFLFCGDKITRQNVVVYPVQAEADDGEVKNEDIDVIAAKQARLNELREQLEAEKSEIDGLQVGFADEEESSAGATEAGLVEVKKWEERLAKANVEVQAKIKARKQQEASSKRKLARSTGERNWYTENNYQVALWSSSKKDWGLFFACFGVLYAILILILIGFLEAIKGDSNTTLFVFLVIFAVFVVTVYIVIKTAECQQKADEEAAGLEEEKTA